MHGGRPISRGGHARVLGLGAGAGPLGASFGDWVRPSGSSLGAATGFLLKDPFGAEGFWKSKARGVGVIGSEGLLEILQASYVGLPEPQSWPRTPPRGQRGSARTLVIKATKCAGDNSTQMRTALWQEGDSRSRGISNFKVIIFTAKKHCCCCRKCPPPQWEPRNRSAPSARASH